MTTETTGWNAGDYIESFPEAAHYLSVGLDTKIDEGLFMLMLADIANSKWMQQRAKDGKTVVLAGKG